VETSDFLCSLFHRGRAPLEISLAIKKPLRGIYFRAGTNCFAVPPCFAVRLRETASVGNNHCLSDVTVAPVAPTESFQRTARRMYFTHVLALCLSPTGSSLCGFSSRYSFCSDAFGFDVRNNTTPFPICQPLICNFLKINFKSPVILFFCVKDARRVKD